MDPYFPAPFTFASGRESVLAALKSNSLSLDEFHYRRTFGTIASSKFGFGKVENRSGGLQFFGELFRSLISGFDSVVGVDWRYGETSKKYSDKGHCPQ